MPVFEGLILNHDKQILDMLFDLNAVHSFAKFRIHSDFSLNRLETHTTNLGKDLRTFQNKVCLKYATKELQKEVNARQKRRAKANAKKVDKGKGKEKAKNKSEKPDVPRGKKFNLCTYKTHPIGYYPHFIRMF